MVNSRKLAVFGLFCVLCFAVATLPARIPLQLIGGEQVRFSGVSGTVWRATISSISVGNLQLSNNEWQIAPLKLLTGQLGGQIKSRWNGGFMNAAVGISLLGTLIVTDGEVNTTAAWLAGSAGLPPLDGQVRINIELAELAGNWPTAVVGTVTIDGLASSLIGVGRQGYIGNVVAEFANPEVPDTGAITAVISDAGGPLQMTGLLELAPPGAYALNVKLTPGAEASDALRENLRFLGNPDSAGAYQFALDGSL